MMSAKKQYGLVLSSRKKPSAPVARSSVFGDSSSDEDDTGRGHVNSSLQRENEKRSRQMREDMARAKEDDPTVFEYDSLYDSMVAQRQKADPRLKKKDRKPRYIESLKRITERRKIEQDIIYERKAQRELEQEGAEFGDKDTFLTSGYRQKLKEREALERELAKEEERERANDVKSQKDLTKFYRHMLDGTDSKDLPPPPPPPPAMAACDRPASPQNPPLESAAEPTTGDRQGGSLGSSEEPERPPLERPTGTDEEDEEEEQKNGETPRKTSLLDLSEEEIAAAKDERKRKAFAKRTDDEALGSARERFLARKKARLDTKQQVDS